MLVRKDYFTYLHSSCQSTWGQIKGNRHGEDKMSSSKNTNFLTPSTLSLKMISTGLQNCKFNMLVLSLSPSPRFCRDHQDDLQSGCTGLIQKTVLRKINLYLAAFNYYFCYRCQYANFRIFLKSDILIKYF